MAPNEILEILFLIGFVFGIVIYATRVENNNLKSTKCKLHRWENKSQNGKDFLICTNCMMIPSILNLEEDED